MPVKRKPKPLAEMLPAGPISAWPDHGDWSDRDGDWIVGVAMHGIFGAPYKIVRGDKPLRWKSIAVVDSAALAVALAAHLEAVRDGGVA